jgi:hypothetical protein
MRKLLDEWKNNHPGYKDDDRLCEFINNLEEIQDSKTLEKTYSIEISFSSEDEEHQYQMIEVLLDDETNPYFGIYHHCSKPGDYHYPGSDDFDVDVGLDTDSAITSFYCEDWYVLKEILMASETLGNWIFPCNIFIKDDFQGYGVRVSVRIRDADDRYGKEHKIQRSKDYYYFDKCLKEILEYPVFDHCNIIVYPDDEMGYQYADLETKDGHIHLWYEGDNTFAVNKEYVFIDGEYIHVDEYANCDWNKLKAVFANAKTTNDIVFSD